MIKIIHENNLPNEVYNGISKINFESKALPELLFEMANKFPDKTIVWCHKKLKSSINSDVFDEIFHHSLIMTSFTTSNTFVISDDIGYVEQASPFIHVNFKVKYPTWKMSSDVGGINAQVLNTIKDTIKNDECFEYFLCSLAKIEMPNGLLCYSNPKLLIGDYPVITKGRYSNYILFKFVKQHYKIIWTLLLLLNIVIYKKKFLIFPFIKSFFHKKKKSFIDFKEVSINTLEKRKINFSLDVIIPTLGRATYLKDVLKDLSKQTILPKRVIIIEQSKNRETELNYLNDNWPFEIDHALITQLGACNARNMALEKVTADWVFFADDDVRFSLDFIMDSYKSIITMNASAITVSCLLDNETEKHSKLFQWSTFGSGCSFVTTKVLKDIRFDMAFEHGYGEDTDFGMQLRNIGCDILYVPHVQMRHLKAPVGGFRTKFIHVWDNDSIQPKPSPTVMLYKLKYNSEQQILGYKTLLFIKYFKQQEIKNPFKYISEMNKQWKQSKKWSKILQKRRNEI